jgi:hypothetical protein
LRDHDIEHDYQELKQEVGLGHFEGRGWHGFHLELSLIITRPPQHGHGWGGWSVAGRYREPAVRLLFAQVFRSDLAHAPARATVWALGCRWRADRSA